jgi:monothiol glutaredoxin
MNELTNIEDVIKKEIEENAIILYMKGSREIPQCGFSARVIEILNTLNIEYVTRNVLEDNELREGIKVFSNWPTIPQLYIKGEFIGGCDIVMQLFDNGELKELTQ